MPVQQREGTPCPELNLWLLRLASDESVLRILFDNPLLFGAVYSSVKHVMSWPEELTKIVSASSQKPSVEKGDGLSDRLAELTERLGVPAPPGFAADLTEAVVVLNYYRKRGFAVLLEHANARLDEVETPLLMLSQCQDSAIYANLYSMGEALSLTKVEEQVLLFAILMNVSDSVCFLFSLLFSNSTLADTLLPVMLDCEPEELSALLFPSVLVKSGLLTQHPQQPFPIISGYWTDRFVTGPEGEGLLPGNLVEELRPGPDNGFLPSMAKEDQATCLKLLRSRGPTSGFNVLFYGNRSVNKRTLAYTLTKSARARAFMLRADSRASGGDRAIQCYLAQQYIKARAPKAVLVVERATSLLAAMPSFTAFSLGVDLDDDEPRSEWDELLLDENPVKTIWLTNAAEGLSQSSLSRFLFHFEVKKGTRSEHQAHLLDRIKNLGLSQETQSVLQNKQGLSERQILNAVRAAAILGKRAPEKEAFLLRAIDSSQKAMARKDAEVLNGTVTEYHLDYLNTSGKFKPDHIIRALRQRPLGSLCLFGLAGTGKTQFAEKLAAELDRPLMVKRASDILSKWHGESEQRIAQMFKDAEAEDAVLFLDEADSFLRDRSKARESWQITQTNELLQCMERFRGVFVCATNLFKEIDQAALRRFTFKLNFLPLTSEMRLKMFLRETGLDKNIPSGDELSAWAQRLDELEGLAPGDFATVKRQSLIIGENLSPEDWLSQLKTEVDLKSYDAAAMGTKQKSPPRFC